MGDCPGNLVDGACAQRTESIICCVPSNSLCTIHSASTCSLPAFALKSVAQDPEFLQIRKVNSGRTVKKIFCDPKPRVSRFKPEVPTRRVATRGQNCKNPCCCPCYCCNFIGDLKHSECLERLVEMLRSRGSTMEEIDEIWRCYEVQAICGPHIKNLVLLGEIVQSLDAEVVNIQLDPKFVYKIIGHLRRGIRVQSLSENGNVQVIVEALDQFAKTLEIAADHVCIAILGMVLQWFKIYRDQNALPDEVPLEATKENQKQHRKKTQGPGRQDALNHFETPEACGDFNRLQVQSRQEQLLNGSALCRALEHSILASVLERLVTSNARVKNRFLYLRVLQTMKFMCENSYHVRSHLLKTQLVTSMIAKLESLAAAPPVLEATIDLYFALVLEGVPEAGEVEVSSEAFGYLIELLIDAITNFKKYGKALRNQVALVALSIGRICPSVVATAFEPYAKDIAAILSDKILGCEIGKVAASLTWNKEDLQLIQNLVWLLGLVIGSADVDGRFAKVIEDHEIVKALLTLSVSGPDALEGRKTGAEADLVEYIRKAALVVLKDLLRKVSIDVVQRAAPIISAAVECSSKWDWDHTALEAASGAALEVIKRAPEACEDLMIGVLALLDKLTPDAGYSPEQETAICNALLCISALAASGDEELMAMLVNSDAIILLVRLMHLIIYPYERKSSPWLELVVSDCIWTCVSNQASAKQAFVAEEGVLRLLDLLEVASSIPAKSNLIGALLHLCQDKACLAQTMAWERRLRSVKIQKGQPKFPEQNTLDAEIAVSENKTQEIQTDHTFCALLCEIWREEELETGVLRTDMGEIASSTYPLMTEFGRSRQAGKGAEILDVEEEKSVRPKIAVLVKLMVDRNREMAIFAGLSLKNQLTMQIVLNYVDLKTYEIYRGLNAEMEEEGMELIQDDRDRMSALIDLYENKVNAIKHTQEYLILRANEEKQAGEQDLYQKIRRSQMEDLLEFLKKAEQNKKGDSGGYFLLVDKRIWNSSEMGIMPEEISEAAIPKSVEVDDQVESEVGKEEGAGDGGPDKPATELVNADDGLGPAWAQKLPIHVPTQIGININKMRASSVPPIVLEKHLRKLQADEEKRRTKMGASASSRLVKKTRKSGQRLESNFESKMFN